jgi:hypothetical protein
MPKNQNKNSPAYVSLSVRARAALVEVNRGWIFDRLGIVARN